jgi:hypothetical protein
MTGVREVRYVPDRQSVPVYNRLYKLYRRLYDAFGTREYADGLYDVMKELLRIRDQVTIC